MSNDSKSSEVLERTPATTMDCCAATVNEPTMRCHCCQRPIPLARKVKIRWLIDRTPKSNNPSARATRDVMGYLVYAMLATYRWGVICLGCYGLLDNRSGAARIGGRFFNIAGASRQGKATVINEAKFRAWKQREARKVSDNQGNDRIPLPESIRAQTVAFILGGMPARVLADWLEDKGIRSDALLHLRGHSESHGGLEQYFELQDIAEAWVERLRPTDLLIPWSTLAIEWPDADRERLLGLLTTAERQDVLSAWGGAPESPATTGNITEPRRLPVTADN